MVDLIKQEERLINTELTIRDAIKQKEILSKIDKLILKHSERDVEKLSVDIKTAEHLSKDGSLKMPLRVRGTMLGVGRHKEKYYTAEALQLAIEKYRNKKIPIKVDHRYEEIGATIGAIDLIEWSNNLNAIVFEGHINNETHARNLLDKLYSNVSASIFSIKEFDEKLGVVGLDLEFEELSIVRKGAYVGNSIEPVI